LRREAPQRLIFNWGESKANLRRNIQPNTKNTIGFKTV